MIFKKIIEIMNSNFPEYIGHKIKNDGFFLSNDIASMIPEDVLQELYICQPVDKDPINTEETAHHKASVIKYHVLTEGTNSFLNVNALDENSELEDGLDDHFASKLAVWLYQSLNLEDIYNFQILIVDELHYAVLEAKDKIKNETDMRIQCIFSKDIFWHQDSCKYIPNEYLLFMIIDQRNIYPDVSLEIALGKVEQSENESAKKASVIADNSEIRTPSISGSGYIIDETWENDDGYGIVHKRSKLRMGICNFDGYVDVYDDPKYSFLKDYIININKSDEIPIRKKLIVRMWKDTSS